MIRHAIPHPVRHRTVFPALACAVALASCATTAPSAPPAADWEWNRIDWSSLKLMQLALAGGDAPAALTIAGDVQQDSLSPPEAMWLEIYRGIALDRLARRAEALEAYRLAARLHPHPVSQRGLRAPLYTLKHLEKLVPGSQG